mmetsp:Transcript_15921/g.21054  ORF Transcript_15921/g.21054 Transcript_15921/m.21054 type:complete len:356 (-) Transcript_15921:167-1234(-)|eukprot:CAMPEP_0117745962 /NCGR_PEP_ID=MMETSP0947-20121206/7674_1 /TAXON_ID=44440 /ORGANISM="Chattonella subsalsa, Strain CCMP2191" /LENGTH=355 /DNA_ID=CAMNT_0005563217 /DNA_START=307 /DNA_END=1374 /DNA_ORIENTATION=+
MFLKHLEIIALWHLIPSFLKTTSFLYKSNDQEEQEKDSAQAKTFLPLHEHIFAAVTLGLLCGWGYVLLIVYMILLYQIIVNGSIISGTLLALIISMGYWPADHNPWEKFLRSWIFRTWRKYFDWEMVISEELDPKKKYMFAEFPHGIFPMGTFLSASVVPEYFPGQKIFGMGASVIFRGPVYRHIMAWIGTKPVTKQNFKEIYDQGHHAVVCVGGIAEIFLVSKQSENIYLNKRKGFVKVAIENGANLVPMFFYGNSRILDLVQVGGDQNADGNWLVKLCRRQRFACALYKGRFGLPIPYRQKIKLISGKPIEVKQQQNPSEEYVNEIHKKFVEQLQVLYKEYLPAWEDRPLVIH